MEFLHVSGFDVQPGKNREFQAWVRANSAALDKAMPKGNELVGIYASIFGSEKHSGGYKMIFRLDSYGAMDQFAAAVNSNAELARLMNELYSFADQRIGSDYSIELLKSVADTSIWADFPEE